MCIVRVSHSYDTYSLFSKRVQRKEVNMNNKCIFLMFRKKKGLVYCYCKNKRAIIERSECYSCINKEYKKVAKMASKTPIKAVSKKRVFVSKKTYEIVLKECSDYLDVPHCQFCNKITELQLHHIYYRSERKDLIDEPSNCIMLCSECHSLVHSNKRKYQPILLDIKNKTRSI